MNLFRFINFSLQSAEKFKFKQKDEDLMLFKSKKVKKAGCISAGVIVCASAGYSKKGWSV